MTRIFAFCSAKRDDPKSRYWRGSGKRTASYCHPIPEFVEPLRFNGKFDTR
jgi:hypothetical protein